MAPKKRTKKHKGTAVDSHFFKSLTSIELARYVFPHPVCKDSKPEVIEHFIDQFFKRFGLRLCYSKTAKTWFPPPMSSEDASVRKPVPIFHPDNSYADLYCRDCRECRDHKVLLDGNKHRKLHGELQVVATVQFCEIGNGLFSGHLSHLYYHNVHNEGGHLQTLMSSGWCVINHSILGAGVYDDAIEQCRDCLHPQRRKTTEHPTDLLPIGEWDDLDCNGNPKDNRYYLMLSGAGPKWNRRVPNSCCNDDNDGKSLVALTKHREVVVTLFYAICVKLGLASIASPVSYTTSDFRVKQLTVQHKESQTLFCNEESILVGGFATSGTVGPQRLHCDSDTGNFFSGRIVNNCLPTAEELVLLFAAGMSLIHPLSEEGREIHSERKLYSGVRTKNFFVHTARQDLYQ